MNNSNWKISKHVSPGHAITDNYVYISALVFFMVPEISRLAFATYKVREFHFNLKLFFIPDSSRAKLFPDLNIFRKKYFMLDHPTLSVNNIINEIRSSLYAKK